MKQSFVHKHNVRKSFGKIPELTKMPNLLEIQKNSYEPVSQENIAKAMKEVKEFFLRNSDGTFHLDAVITPTVTIPVSKWADGLTKKSIR